MYDIPRSSEKVFAPGEVVTSRFSGVTITVSETKTMPGRFSGTVLDGKGLYEEGYFLTEWLLDSFEKIIPAEKITL